MGRQAPLVLVGIGLAIAGAAFVLLSDKGEPGEPGVPTDASGPVRDGLSQGERVAQQNTARLLGLADRADTEQTRVATGLDSTAAGAPRVTARPPAVGEARISGFIKVAMRPTGGAKLTATDDAGNQLAQATSEADGSWALYVKPGVAFTLHASYAMTVPHARAVPALTERAMQRAGNISLLAGRLVTGTVLDGEGRPIPDAWAAIEAQSSTQRALFDSVDAAGKLTLENAPMSATIEVGAPGFEHHFLTLSSDEVQNIVLVPGRAAEVFVHDPSGNPIHGANVMFVRANIADGQSATPTVRLLGGGRQPGVSSPGSRHSVQTDVNGIARTSELGPGQYWAEVTHQAYRAALPTNIPTAEEAALVGARFEAQMEPRPRLHFAIVDEDGNVPARLLVTITHMDGDWPSTQKIGPKDGVVDVFVSKKTSYTVRAWAEGFHVGKFVTESDTKQKSAARLQLERADQVPLFLVDSDGVPIEGAKFQVHMWTQNVAASEVASAIHAKNTWHGPMQKQPAGGGLTVQTFAGDDWPLFAIEAPGFQPQLLPFSAWPEPTQKDGALSITIELERSASLQVTVLDKNGSLVPGALIYLTVNGEASPTGLPTDAFGIATSADLPAGTISLMARGPNGELTQREEVKLAVGARTDVTLTLR